MLRFVMANRLGPSSRIRRQEIKLVMDELCIRKGTRILEIGCGSGLQSTFLSEKSSFVVSSDVALKQLDFRTLCLVKCCGEYLPLKSSSFDMVYASNVLEHIKNRSLALGEMRRVLKREGILVCVVPTYIWKILQFILYYPEMIYDRLSRMKQEKQPKVFYNNRHKEKNPLWIAASVRHLMPSIHGEFKGNAEEIVAYQKKNWIHLLETNGFHVYKIKKLLLYAPLGKLREKNITIVPPSLKLEKITGLYSSIALFANLKNH